MKYEIIILKYKPKELFSALSFYLFIVILFLLIFYFGLNLDPGNIITSTFTALIMIIFQFWLNKNAVLKISGYNDPDTIKDVVERTLAKNGLVPIEENKDEIKFHYRTKMNRFIASFFFDHVILKTSGNELLLYGKRSRLISLKMSIEQEMKKKIQTTVGVT